MRWQGTRVSEWRQLVLGDVLEVRHGLAFKGKHFGQGGATRLITPGNFYERGGFRDRGSVQKSYDGDVPDGYVLNPGALVVAMTEQSPGLLGSSALIPDDGQTWLHNQRIGLVLSDPALSDDRFIYYLMNEPSVRNQISATATGTKVRHTAPKRLQAVRARMPPLATQRRIASVLSAFDELIEINDRQIELLENLARSLYREWFVRFRFPGHEDVEFVDSELGQIPEGWDVCTVGDVAELIRGRSYRRTELSESDGVPFLNLKCVNRGGGFRRSGLKRYVGRYKETQVTVPGDVLVAVTDMTQERRIVAQAFRMPDLGEPFAIPSLDLALLKPAGQHMRVFMYATLRYSGFSERVRQFANGANVLHLAVERIQEYSFAIPNEDLIRSFEKAAGAILDGAEFLQIQNRRFAETRDLLLPRLVTGRLDISDIELGILTPAQTE